MTPTQVLIPLLQLQYCYVTVLGGFVGSLLQCTQPGHLLAWEYQT